MTVLTDHTYLNNLTGKQLLVMLIKNLSVSLQAKLKINRSRGKEIANWNNYTKELLYALKDFQA